MLIDAQEVYQPNFGSFVAALVSGGAYPTQRLRQGVYLLPYHPPSPWPPGNRFRDFPDLPDGLYMYGVCDGLDNYMEKQGRALDALDKKYFVTLTVVERDPDGKGKRQGWRWHKWGPYIGACEPEREYLDDEEGIDQVYCFQVFEQIE